MVPWLIILAQIVPVLIFIYFYFDRKNNYWSSRNVKGPSPWPILGNLPETLYKGQMFVEKDWRKKYGKVYGNYMILDPVLTITDVELIKQVLIKDFHVFVNRDKNPFDHEIWNKNLFSSEDEQWKRIRAITSPSFTTGKLRGMHALMNRCVDKLGEYFDRVIQLEQGKMNIKEVILGFTIDVIASTSFATETNANGDRTKKNPFLENGVKFFSLQIWRFVLLFLLPNRFNRAIGNSLGLSDKRFNFFRDLSKEIMRQRREEKVSGRKCEKRQDLVQLLMDAFVYDEELEGTDYNKLTAKDDDSGYEESTKPEKTTSTATKRSLTDNEIIAQCILFFAAGFETTATTLSNCLYNLAINPEVQERLSEEINSTLDGLEYGTDEYYEVIMNKSPYLEAVLKETLRMFPPVGRLQRRVGVDNYKLAGIQLDRDIEVDISTLAVHYAEEYYPEPEKFNPDRFLPENKKNLVPYTYLPFGAGPRNCIGMRFAYQEMKLCLAKIAQQYKFEPTAETKIPLDFNKFGIISSKNIPLKVSKR